MYTLGDSKEEITDINVTPFVDVMLVLLVIFMVTANYIVSQAIQVELPKAATGESVATENLAFVLDKSSNLYINGQMTTFEELPQRIGEKQKEGKGLQALISADKETPHGAVVKLIDVVRKSGISDFAINVESGDTN
jgi:biopolymer transport protein ExbD